MVNFGGPVHHIPFALVMPSRMVLKQSTKYSGCTTSTSTHHSPNGQSMESKHLVPIMILPTRKTSAYTTSEFREVMTRCTNVDYTSLDVKFRINGGGTQGYSNSQPLRYTPVRCTLHNSSGRVPPCEALPLVSTQFVARRN